MMQVKYLKCQYCKSYRKFYNRKIFACNAYCFKRNVGIYNKKFSKFKSLLAGFPAGTVSGAPKIRAMEIIDELEIE